jgi:phage baseplate assembly protein gpV
VREAYFPLAAGPNTCKENVGCEPLGLQVTPGMSTPMKSVIVEAAAVTVLVSTDVTVEAATVTNTLSVTVTGDRLTVVGEVGGELIDGLVWGGEVGQEAVDI